MNMESRVLERYSAGAEEKIEALCCPVDYDSELLQILPREIVEKDYGCGDPSRFVRPGETVLDLGSGSGKNCYMAAQIVGRGGSVIGVDMNDDMLALARKYQPEMATKLGDDRVRFVKGYIQDLALDVEAMEHWLRANPVTGAGGLAALEQWKETQRRDQPLIADNSIDLVISNCVLNLVDDAQKSNLIREIFRVVKPGGRVAISDIVSDEPIPAALKADAKLWSGCISGAFQEQAFLAAFLDAGFLAVCINKWGGEPWQTIDGIEFRSLTITAMKPVTDVCIDRGQAVIYRGPFSLVRDDDGHEFPRGERMAVCEKTFRLLTEGPYKDDFIGILPATERVPKTWCAPPGTRRPAAETKGAAHVQTGADDCCC